jgi:large subunit ribosomal protein L32e
MAEENEKVKETIEEETPKKKTAAPKKKPVKPEEKETGTKEKEDVKTLAPPKKTRVRKVKKETPKPESKKEEKKEEEPSKEEMEDEKEEEKTKTLAPPKKTQVKKVKKETPKPKSKKVEKKGEEPSEEEIDDEEEKEEEIEIIEEEEKETEYKVKIKPKLSKELKHDLKVRKSIKDKTPHFKQQEWFRYKRINESWRRPRGMHSKMRKHKGYRPNVVSVGYGSPKKTRHLHPSGFQEIMVYNTKDLEKINPKSQAARVGHSVGTRKRIEIEAQAEKKGIRILNPRRL